MWIWIWMCTMKWGWGWNERIYSSVYNSEYWNGSPVMWTSAGCKHEEMLTPSCSERSLLGCVMWKVKGQQVCMSSGVTKLCTLWNQCQSSSNRPAGGATHVKHETRLYQWGPHKYRVVCVCVCVLMVGWGGLVLTQWPSCLLLWQSKQ